MIRRPPRATRRSSDLPPRGRRSGWCRGGRSRRRNRNGRDRKSTRLNSSHQIISYAVFCLKKNSKQLYPFVNISSYFLKICKKILKVSFFFFNDTATT